MQTFLHEKGTPITVHAECSTAAWRAHTHEDVKIGDRELSSDKPVTSGAERRVGHVLFIAFLSFAVLYFARALFEPMAFALFGMALVWPIQEAIANRTSKFIALIITVILALAVLLVFVWAIVWSVGDVVHWVSDNSARFQSLYVRLTEWLEDRGIFIAGAFDQFDVRTFVGLFKGVAAGVNYFVGFCLVIFLFLMFGLTELDDFRIKFKELETKIGWDISKTAGDIARKIRKYMFIRTLTSVLTGLAVFAFTLSIGLDLAIAWGVISFVLNYIPYLGPLIAVVLPVLFATAQFEILENGSDHFWRPIRNSIFDRQLS